jgi:hypothetical protein
MQYISFYSTKDQYEIYTLIAASHTIDGYELQGASVYFIFEDKEACEKTLRLLVSQKLKIYAHDMIQAITMAQGIFRKETLKKDHS